MWMKIMHLDEDKNEIKTVRPYTEICLKLIVDKQDCT